MKTVTCYKAIDGCLYETKQECIEANAAIKRDTHLSLLRDELYDIVKGTSMQAESKAVQFLVELLTQSGWNYTSTKWEQLQNAKKTVESKYRLWLREQGS